MDVGAGDLYCVNQPAVFIHADVSFIAEVPAVPLFHRVRFRVSFLFPVLCRGRRCDQGRVHYGSLLQQQASFLQQIYHLRKQLLLQPAAEQQIPEPTQCISVRHLIARFHSAEFRECTAVDHFRYRCLVRQIIQVLNQINPQHPF